MPDTMSPAEVARLRELLAEFRKSGLGTYKTEVLLKDALLVAADRLLAAAEREGRLREALEEILVSYAEDGGSSKLLANIVRAALEDKP